MAKAWVEIGCKDNASGVIEQVTKRLGVFNKEGMAMGVTFALINKGIQLAEQGFQKLTDEMKKSIERTMDFEVNMARITNTIQDMDVTTVQLSNSLRVLSVEFGINLNSIAESYRNITREGYSASESINIMHQAMLVNTSTGEDLNSVIDAMDTTLGVFNLDARNSGYVFEKLNQIFSLTGFSIQEIANILSRASPDIRAAGYDLEDIVNIIYTLKQTEISSRQFPSELDKYLKGLGTEKIMALPEGSVPSVEEGANKVLNTHKKAVDQIGAAWDFFMDKQATDVLNIIDLIPKIGEGFAKGFGQNVKKPSESMGDTSLYIDSVANQMKKIASITAEIEKIQTNINTTTALASQKGTEIYRTNSLLKYTTAMHDATLAVQEQEDAIEQLDRVSRKYNMEQQINTLEIMKIQYGAMGRRRGLSRGEKKEIEEYERMNMGIQIKEQENQIKIGNIQMTCLQNALDEQEQIRRDYTQQVYNQDIIDLNINLNSQREEYRQFFEDIAQMRQKILGYKTGLPNKPFIGPIQQTTSNTVSELTAMELLQNRGIFKRRG